MSTTVKTGWLKDNNGEKFAPKTLSSQVQTSDGTLFEDKIQADLDNLKSEIIDNISIEVDSALSSTSTNPVQNKVLDAEFEAIADAMGALELAVDTKLSDYYTKAEIDSMELITVDDIDAICNSVE